MDYFISDTHFGHSNIIKFERFNFKNIEEHDNYIISLLEKKLSKDDVLYHLGDFGNPSKEIEERYKKLPCKKIIILGNHDKRINYLKNIFDVVQREPIFYKKRILLSHEPLPVKDDTLNVHGHLHNAILNKENYINISIDVYNYNLLSEKELNILLIKIQKTSEEFLEEWYSNLYKFTKKNKDVIYNEDGSINLIASRELRTDNKIYSLMENLYTDWSQKNIFPGKILNKYYNINTNNKHSDYEIFEIIISNISEKFPTRKINVYKKDLNDDYILYTLEYKNKSQQYLFLKKKEGS